MPTVTSGNTYAPSLMIGAKAADLILGRVAPAAADVGVAAAARDAAPREPSNVAH
jgi:choline dehydrogenase-like flavoprotein